MNTHPSISAVSSVTTDTSGLSSGIEKNADVVKLASYAPLFNRIGHSQWKPDMIWFDDSDVYLTPNYYVQKLFANHRGTYTIPLQKQDVKLRKEGIYVSAAVDAHGEIILKLVNTNHREYALMLEDADGLAVRTTGQMWTLRGTGEMPEDRPEVLFLKEMLSTRSTLMLASIAAHVQVHVLQVLSLRLNHKVFLAHNNIKNQKLQVFNEIKRSISTLFGDCIEVNTS